LPGATTPAGCGNSTGVRRCRDIKWCRRDQALAGAGLRVDQAALGRDLDRLALHADLELDLDAGGVVRADPHLLGFVRLEAGERDPQRVAAGIDRGEEKSPFAVTASRANLVDSLTSTTAAPGTNAPDASATVPRRLPELWASAGVAIAATTTAQAIWYSHLLSIPLNLQNQGRWTPTGLSQRLGCAGPAGAPRPDRTAFTNAHNCAQLLSEISRVTWFLFLRLLGFA
jgi:hypothetical protein